MYYYCDESHLYYDVSHSFKSHTADCFYDLRVKKYILLSLQLSIDVIF